MGLRKKIKNYFVKSCNETHIEAEEVFWDKEAIKSMEEKGKMEKPISSRNFVIFFAIVLLSLSSLFVRSAYLQVAKGDYYYHLAQGNRLRVYSTIPPRGIIYDKNENPLVLNTSRFNLIIDVDSFLENSRSFQKKHLSQVISIIEKENKQPIEDNAIISNQKIENLIEEINSLSKKSYLILAPDLDRSDALILESQIYKWPEFRIEEVPRRKYLDGDYFVHLLGYTGRINIDELKDYSGYNSNDYIGKTGIERYYESLLRGEPGQKQVEVNSLGEVQGVVAVKDSKPGNSLVLSIDKELQKKVQDSLISIMEKVSKPGDKKKKAAAVALNPQNGKILAAVSLPSFDNNLFAKGISRNQLKELENNPANPFLNRFSVGQYPPGSLIKPLMASAGLSENIINPYHKINCHGRLSIINKYTNEPQYYNDWKTHGKTDMIKAIAESCNVYFYILGGGYEDKSGLGQSLIKNYFQKFGLGSKTGIDLPSEEDGRIPDKSWKKEIKGENWYLGDTYNLSIGQGDVLVTPLQITNALSVIANRGTLYQPQILDKVLSPDKRVIKQVDSKILKDNLFKKENLDLVRRGMREAVKSGSAVRLNSLNVNLAGKTGTAQFGSEGKTHSWFSGFGPYEDPEIILTVLVEGGGEGHDAAVPVAEEVFRWYFEKDT